MNGTIAVVGAGISGLLVARALKARVGKVMVLEKSRGLCGRLTADAGDGADGFTVAVAGSGFGAAGVGAVGPAAACFLAFSSRMRAFSASREVTLLSFSSAAVSVAAARARQEQRRARRAGGTVVR